MLKHYIKLSDVYASDDDCVLFQEKYAQKTRNVDEKPATDRGGGGRAKEPRSHLVRFHAGVVCKYPQDIIYIDISYGLGDVEF